MNKQRSTYLYYLYNKDIPNEIKYIGKTCNPNTRLIQHKSRAKTVLLGKNKDTHLYRWIRSVNFNIELKILKKIDDWKEGCNEEIKLIKSEKDKGSNLVNTTMGGDGLWGLYKSDNPNSKKVIQYDLEGYYVNKFNSIIEAEEYTGIKAALISGCTTIKRIKSAGGFIWRNFKEDYNEKIEKYKHNGSEISKILFSKMIYQYSEKGELINSFSSLREANRITGYDRCNISFSARNNVKRYKYFWSFTKQ